MSRHNSASRERKRDGFPESADALAPKTPPAGQDESMRYRLLGLPVPHFECYASGRNRRPGRRGRGRRAIRRLEAVSAEGAHGRTAGLFCRSCRRRGEGRPVRRWRAGRVTPARCLRRAMPRGRDGGRVEGCDSPRAPARVGGRSLELARLAGCPASAALVHRRRLALPLSLPRELITVEPHRRVVGPGGSPRTWLAAWSNRSK